jgi:hypothetical protein
MQPGLPLQLIDRLNAFLEGLVERHGRAGGHGPL